MHRVLAAVVSTLALVSPTLAQPETPVDPGSLVQATRSAFATHSSRGYLAALANLTDHEDAALASDMTRTFYLDLLGAQWALLGQQARATEAGDRAFPRQLDQAPDPEAARDLVERHHPANAVDAIVDAARDRRIVMLNEEHRSSRQRAFANQLLEPLRELGFTHLALETLSEDQATLAARGYPLINSGTYTKDPAFGDLVRRALELGFVVYGYEAAPELSRPREGDTSPLDAANRREAAQAQNIFDRALRDNPDARVLILAGRDHIAEDGGGDWIPMGAVLAQLSGIDPLSVSLMTMCEHSERQFEHWAYHAAEKAGWLADDGTLWSAIPGVLDAHVFFPRTQLVGGRPDWMAMDGIRTHVTVDTPEFETRVLLQTLVNGETEDAVPLDQALWTPGEPRPDLLLRPGKYVIRAVDRDGQVLFEQQLMVQ